MQYPPCAEWLETTGTGAFAMGTVSRVRTRRYHALLMSADSPSCGRRVLVPGFDAWIEIGGARIDLTSQRYSGGVQSPPGDLPLSDFRHRPWPRWTFKLPGDAAWTEEVFISSDTGETVLRWSGRAVPDGARFYVRLFTASRDYHALQSRDENLLRMPLVSQNCIQWLPMSDEPVPAFFTEGAYRHDPYWYERFEYGEDQHRGLDCVEDLASPGVISWTVGGAAPQPVLVLRTTDSDFDPTVWEAQKPARYAARLAQREAARRRAMTPLEFSASQYIVARGHGKSIIAGYPWFTDWGRDTFIALRGLYLSLQRLDDARDIIETWATKIEGGLLPNSFTDSGDIDYGAVDSSLWFIVAIADYIRAARAAGRNRRNVESELRGLAQEILRSYLAGTKFGIRADADGLLAAGEPFRAATWMDAKIDGRPVTPRVGKPVEVQCLWVNALESVRGRSLVLDAALRAARASFARRFWRADLGYLADVVDVDHIPGTDDPSLRPNQIFAVGGLPYMLVSKQAGRSIVQKIEQELWTPMGLRTLSPGDPRYCGLYCGGPNERDAAYHQGPVWPWLIDPFVHAWLRMHGDTPGNRKTARTRFLAPLVRSLERYGLGHIAEVADGDLPHRPGGCPFQAWSLGGYLRAKAMCAPIAAKQKIMAL